MKFSKYLLAFSLLSIIFLGGAVNSNSAVHSESALPSLISTFENGKLYLSRKGEGYFYIPVLKAVSINKGTKLLISIAVG